MNLPSKSALKFGESLSSVQECRDENIGDNVTMEEGDPSDPGLHSKIQ